MGRADLVTNISSTTLSTIETEALSFGLKFATGLKNNISKLINLNYRHSDTDFHKGFTQGILAASLDCQNTEFTLPKRYMNALKSLSTNSDITISPSDKGGGVVVMDTAAYNQKMLDLLNDRDTYEQISPLQVSKNVKEFNKSYKSLIRNEDKIWLSLINYHPTIPKIYGFPKTHKLDIPLSPIISGIGSAPHNIAF